MTSTDRLTYLDYAKGISIVLVVWGHVLADNSPIKIWIYSFHLPLFFLVTGMLMAYRQKWAGKRLFDNFTAKAGQLLYPYLTFSILAILWVIVYQVVFHTGSVSNITRIVLDTLFLDGYRTLWFLPAIFFAELLFIGLSRLKTRYFFLTLLVLYCMLSGYFFRVELPISETLLDNVAFKTVNIINRALIGTLFIWLGYIIFPILERKPGNFKNNLLALAGVLVFAANIAVSQINRLVDLHYSVVNNPLLYYICALSGSLSLILILKYFLVHNSVFEYFGKNSLVIMATHFTLPVIFIAEKIVSITRVSIGYVFDSLLTLVLIMLFEVAIIEVINRFMPWLVKLKRKA